MLEQPPKQGLLSCLNEGEGEGEGEKKRKEKKRRRRVEDQFEVFIFFCIFKEIGQSKRERQREGGKKKDEEKKYSEVSEVNE